MLCKYNFALCKLCPGPQAYVAQVIVAVRSLTMSQRTLTHPQARVSVETGCISHAMSDNDIHAMAETIVDEFQRHLDDEQDQSDIRRGIQALYRRAALMEERKESQSRACKLSKMRNNFPKNTLKHKESLGKKRLQCRVPYIIRHGEPGEMPVDFVKKVFLKQMYDLGKSLARAAPPGCKIYHDLVNGRWMVNLGNSNTQSRSWSKYGHIESGVLILAKAWEGHMELYGLPTCPIEGLMKKAEAIEQNTKSRIMTTIHHIKQGLPGILH